MAGSIFDHLINLPLFQWDSEESRYFKKVSCNIFYFMYYYQRYTTLFAGQELLRSLHSFLILQNRSFRQTRQFSAWSDRCAILKCSIFLNLLFPPPYLVLGAVHRAGAEPTVMQWHGSDHAHTVQKNTLLYYGFITHFFPFPVSYTLRCHQYKLPLAGLCILVPAPPVRSHLTDSYRLRAKTLHFCCSHAWDLQTCLKHKYMRLCMRGTGAWSAQKWHLRCPWQQPCMHWPACSISVFFRWDQSSIISVFASTCP